jgi:2-keto-4-pentenoate hydratase/2-oxohepta-3-ene-1,7-dioic acid hydratase in catechol pathway
MTRLVTYDGPRGPRAGVLRDGGVLDAWDVLGEGGEHSVRALLASGRIADLAGLDGELAAEGDVRLASPVPDPDKIVCIGLNYLSHARETSNEPPQWPTFFAKYRNALSPPGAEVALPRFTDQVDYEAEVAIVIGRRCHDVAAADALDVIAGFTLFNDLSARDLQYRTPQWGPGKVFDGSAPCGPALVTPDEAGAPDAIEFSLTLNGRTLQEGSTADLIHSVADVVAHLSMLMTLEPGDLIATGTPAGVGRRRDPPIFLRPGDHVVIESPTLGRLETRLT